MNTAMGAAAALIIWMFQEPARKPNPYRLMIPDQPTVACIHLAPMPVVRGETAEIAKRYPMQVFRIDSSIVARMPMPVDRRIPCYQLDSTARR
ncbi:MAG: hypothetical protein ACRENU_09285 [Gemmatimonadaceae bacterium]